MGDLFDGYGAASTGPLSRAFDEVVTPDGGTRAPYHDVVSVLTQLTPEEVGARTNRLARAFMDQGVTFDLDGEERPFPLDLVPRIFSGREWDVVAEGVSQRVRALEAFLADIYNEGRILDEGIIPYRAVTSSPGFLREVHGVNPANGVRIHVAGIDVIRDEDGVFRVLEDNIRCPSGVSYVLANRAAMARVLPEVFGGQPIHMVADYPARLVEALRLAAPPGVTDPTVVVLTPGVHNSAFYEHALLARLMGLHLVEGRDLVCRATDVFLRTTEGEMPVHVIYRRIDDDYARPPAIPPRVAGRLPRAGERGAGRPGHGGQRPGQRGGRRQAHLRLRPGHGPLLPRRGAGAAQRGHLPARRRPTSGPTPWPSGTRWSSSGSTARGARTWSSAPSPRRGAGRGGPGRRGRPRGTGWPSGWSPCPPSPTWIGDRLAPRHVDLRPFAVNDGEQVWSCPVGSPGWPSRPAAWW